MNLAAIRSAVSPQSAARRNVLLTLLGVVVIVIGLLAMHTLAASPAHASVGDVGDSARHVVADLSVADVQASVESDGHCGSGDCRSPHALALMTCIFALVAASLVLVAGHNSWRSSPVTIAPAQSLITGLRLAPLVPPSLIVLSISRT